jgi:hypothetical protein
MFVTKKLVQSLLQTEVSMYTKWLDPRTLVVRAVDLTHQDAVAVHLEAEK